MSTHTSLPSVLKQLCIISVFFNFEVPNCVGKALYVDHKNVFKLIKRSAM